MRDKRRFPRQRTLIGGRITFNNRCSTLDCVVRNLTEVGAKVTFADGIAVPSAFELTMNNRGFSRQARIIWRTANEAGVSFEERSNVSGIVPIEAAIRMRQLETERDRLKLRIDALTDPY